MHAHTSYMISIDGDKNEIERATKVIAEAFDDESLIGQETIEITESYKIVWDFDIKNLAVKIAKATPEVCFLLGGTIDTSESGGEYMDFLFTYKDLHLYSQLSCWYRQLFANEFENYKEFSEVFDGYTEEDFEKYRQKVYYVLDSGYGNVVEKVILNEPTEIPIRDGVYCVECGKGPLTDGQIEKYCFLDEYYCSKECINHAIDSWSK